MLFDVIDALKVPFLMCGESTCELASLHLSRDLALCQCERNFSFMNIYGARTLINKKCATSTSIHGPISCSAQGN